jgi:hypothetical protein
MDAFVLYVSACMPWCCEDETTPASEEMLEWAMDGSALHVPSLWTWEILNTVGCHYQAGAHHSGSRQGISRAACQVQYHGGSGPAGCGFPRLHALASLHQLTAYDVAYLNLAIRLSLRLATRDDDLMKAARAEGVRIL